MDVPELHRRTVHYFGECVHAIGVDQWELATPDAEWDVRALVNHLVYEDRWTVPIFAGKTVAEVGDEFEGDLLGADPVQAWDESSAAAISAVGSPGAMERIVHLSFGDVPGSEYAWQLAADHLIHGWDLARAINADDALDPELVDAVASWYADREEMYRAGGAVADRVDVPADADAQTRLLAAFGRAR
jgi:uncharacterized protein (TIGR03086 family)